MYKFIQYSFVFMLIRFVWAYWVPLGNDEAYYWDWSRNLMLSYYDHPPMVSWIGKLGTLLLGDFSYHSRVFVPVLHFFTSILLFLITQNLHQKELSTPQVIVMFLMIQLAPIFSWGGVFILPDIGLVFWVVLSIYIALRILRSKQQSIMMFVLWGLSAGMALNSKYHALVMLPPLFVYVCLHSYRRFSKRYFVLAFLTAMVVSLPVWIWNIQNDWVSFSFQTAHGFKGMNVDFPRGFRLLLAQFLLVSPFVFFYSFIVNARGSRLEYSSLLKWMVVPLWVLLSVLAFFKEVLPHWVLPCYVLCLPLIVLRVESLSRFCRINFWVFGALGLVVPFLAGMTPVTDFVVSKVLNSKPDGFGEFTMWAKVKPILDLRIAKKIEKKSDCHNKVLLGSFRWWWTAQLSVLYPEHQIFNFDHKVSYYDFRDKKLFAKYKGCPLIVIGQKRHFQKSKLKKYVAIKNKKKISIPLHDDRESVVIEGTIR